jgi:tetratricopeptide (TPR) repeat protein
VTTVKNAAVKRAVMPKKHGPPRENWRVQRDNSAPVKKQVSRSWWPIYALLAYALICTGCTDKAVYNPSIAGLNQKAQAFMASGNVDAAIQRLESALDLSPTDAPTRYNLALAYQQKNALDKAIPLLEKLAEQPDTVDRNKVLLVLGQVFEAKGDAQPALPDGKPNPTARLPWYQKALNAYNKIQPRTPDLDAHVQQLQQALSGG